MKIIAVIPYWSGYLFPDESINDRDAIKLGGRALINYTIDLASQVNAIDDVVIYSSNKKVLGLIDTQDRCSFLMRDKALDAHNVSIEDIIENFLLDSNADIVVLMHPKNPFLRKETIASCVEQVKSGRHDSAHVVSQARKLAWFNGKPLNYMSSEDTPSLSSIEPVILESSSVYVFTRELFETKRTRIGDNPFMIEIGHFEGFEVDREDDYTIAELIINSGLEFTGV